MATEGPTSLPANAATVEEASFEAALVSVAFIWANDMVAAAAAFSFSI
jgi:hypothetical protein